MKFGGVEVDVGEIATLFVTRTEVTSIARTERETLEFCESVHVECPISVNGITSRLYDADVLERTEGRLNHVGEESLATVFDALLARDEVSVRQCAERRDLEEITCTWR